MRLRQGNVIVVEQADGDDVMVTADLHGNRLNFESLVDLAAMDKVQDQFEKHSLCLGFQVLLLYKNP